MLIEAITPPVPPPEQAAGPVPTSSDEISAVGAPVRMQIPSIGVDAFIEHVGLTADGAMDVPKDSLDTAWYALGPRPGDIGSAVIAGHVDWFDGAVGVFEDLHTLLPGDEIRVQDHSGAFHEFVVRETRIYAADADATDIFLSNDGKSHLNLITCTGTWDPVAGQYPDRLVVFADQKN